MLFFWFAYATAFLAMAASYFRLLARAKELRKSSTDLVDGVLKGEELQDIAAILAFIASFAAVIAAAVLPKDDVNAVATGWAVAIFFIAWVAGLVYVTRISKQYRQDDPEDDQSEKTLQK